jgi:hypothetical protein
MGDLYLAIYLRYNITDLDTRHLGWKFGSVYNPDRKMQLTIRQQLITTLVLPPKKFTVSVLPILDCWIKKTKR